MEPPEAGDVQGCRVPGASFPAFDQRYRRPHVWFLHVPAGGNRGRRIAATGYKILLEILVAGHPHHVVEAPFVFVTRTAGESKLRLNQQLDYLKHIASLMRRKGELARFLKYCLVGASGVLVNMGLLWLLTEIGGLFYLVSAAISIETSIITNFTLNDFFTFPDRRKRGAGQFLVRLLRFNLVSLAGSA